MKIIGPNLETLTKLAEQVRDEMSQVRGMADLGVFPVLGQPNLNIKVDRAKAARYGLNSGDVELGRSRRRLGGAVATTVLEGDRQFNVAVRYPAGIPRQRREDSATSRWPIRRAAAPTPTSR